MLRFDKMAKIAIYGASVGGIELYWSLKNKGYNVLFFIDRDAQNVKEFCGEKVYTLNEMAKLEIDELIIIVSLQNALIHEAIAHEIASYGYNNIIYFPMEGDYNSRRLMREIWMQIKTFEFNSISTIPVYKKIDTNVISEFENHVSVWCDLKNIRYKTLEMLNRQDAMTEATKKGKAIWERYVAKSIELVEPYTDLFDYLEGKVTTPELYLQACRNGANTPEKEKLLKDRRKLYSQYVYGIKYDPDMFILAPATAEYHEGLFYIVDGMHRAVFLQREGYTKIPILISREDYNMFKTIQGGPSDK